ncbi:MAG: hypothetical protein PHU78_05575 [Heliobacteriaceae bacterium]|nr:hypothetical protein [Heliobacteriaceae bacterium]
MRKGFDVILLLGFLLTLLPLSTAFAEVTEINTIEQAVRAARAISIQPVSTSPENGMDTNEAALDVALVVIDLDFLHKKFDYLLAQQEELQNKLATAENDFRMGKIEAETHDALNKAVFQNIFELNNCQMQIENGEKSFQKMTGAVISRDFQYDAAYLIIDAGKLSLPPSVDQSAKAEENRKKFSDVLSAYGRLGTDISAYIEAGEKLLAVQKDFKMGKVDKEILETAGAGKEKARLNALEGKAVYSKLLYELDCSLQGYISRDIKQVADPIFLTMEGSL